MPRCCKILPRKLVYGLIFCLLVFVSGCATSPPLEPNHLRLTVMDIGEADSLLIQTEDAKVLVDAGSPDSGRLIVKALKRHRVSRIDLAVMTHPHADHIGGLSYVGNKIPIGEILDSGFSYSSPERASMLRWVARKKILTRLARQGQHIRIGKSLTMQVLWPTQEYIANHPDNPNDSSIVLRVNFGTTHLLLTGDLGEEPEAMLALSGIDLKSDFLKVAHQGSGTSSSALFLNRVRPEIAAICVGRYNSYGHPHRETLQRLNAIGAHIYRTDKDGELVFESDGRRLWKINNR